MRDTYDLRPEPLKCKQLYTQQHLRESTARNRVKEAGTERAKKQVLKGLRDRYLDSFV